MGRMKLHSSEILNLGRGQKIIWNFMQSFVLSDCGCERRGLKVPFRGNSI